MESFGLVYVNAVGMMNMGVHTGKQDGTLTREESIEEIIEVCQMDRYHEVYVEMVGEVLDKFLAEELAKREGVSSE